jgi:hypothetical protein
MNMSGYEIQRDDSSAGYGDEVLSAGWVPRLEQQEVVAQQWENRPTMPADLANVDLAVFLCKMYTHQR